MAGDFELNDDSPRGLTPRLAHRHTTIPPLSLIFSFFSLSSKIMWIIKYRASEGWEEELIPSPLAASKSIDHLDGL